MVEATATARTGVLSRASGLWSRLRWPSRKHAFWMVLAGYVLLTVGVIVHSPVQTVDQYFVNLNLLHHYPNWWHRVHTYVELGQRRPSTRWFLPYFVWVAWRTRSPRPLIMLATALVLLNVSVGAAKLTTGRQGPRGGHPVHEVFAGGDIYPGGHVSNAVVLYGLVAMVALRFRRTALLWAIWASFSVAVGTVYLNTHWVSDDVGGWLAGGLVLLALPSVVPPIERQVAAVTRWAGSRRERRYPLLAILAMASLVGLGYVYLNINWLSRLGLVVVAVMALLIVPAFIPVGLARVRRRRRAAPPGPGARGPVHPSVAAATPTAATSTAATPTAATPTPAPPDASLRPAVSSWRRDRARRTVFPPASSAQDTPGPAEEEPAARR